MMYLPLEVIGSKGCNSCSRGFVPVMKLIVTCDFRGWGGPHVPSGSDHDPANYMDGKWVNVCLF